MRYKLFGKKNFVGSVLIYEGDDLKDVKRHYDDIINDLDFVSADIIDTFNWSVVSYIDFEIAPRGYAKVKKIESKNNRR